MKDSKKGRLIDSGKSLTDFLKRILKRSPFQVLVGMSQRITHTGLEKEAKTSDF